MSRRPLEPKQLGQLTHVGNGGLADRVDTVLEPAHAHRAELLLEEGDAQLRGERRHAVDHREAHAPLPVLGELFDGGQQRRREQLDAEQGVDRGQRADQVEAHLAAAGRGGSRRCAGGSGRDAAAPPRGTRL